jgi:hypothetical protein
MRLRDINKELKEIEERQSLLYIERKKAIKRKFIKCPEKDCGKRSRLGDLIYFQDNYYVPPRGCTEGDYHVPQEEGYTFCPHCLAQLKILTKELNSYRHIFKKMVDVYRDRITETIDKYIEENNVKRISN